VSLSGELDVFRQWDNILLSIAFSNFCITDSALGQETNMEGDTASPNQPSIDAEQEVDMDDDGADEEEESPNEDDHSGLDEDEMRTRQKLNSVATISSLRFQPTSLSRFPIPLCRMLPMPMVRPTLQSDLIKLEQEFVHGYRDGDRFSM